jgi:N4-gp56 family major capsid protein
MAISNSTTLNDLVGQIVSEMAQGAAYATRVMRPLIRSVGLPPGAGSITVPRFQSLSVSSLTEGTAPSSTTWSSDGVTLTPVERGVYVQVSKRALHADPFTDLQPYAEQIGRALGSDEDALILDAMVPSALIVNEQGGGASNIQLADFVAAIGKLEAQNAPGPYYAVFHPVSWGKLRAELDDASAFASVGTKVVEGFGEGLTNLNGYVGSPYGVPCFISTNVNTKDGGDTYENLMFSKEAAAYAFIQDIGVDVDDNVVARAIDMMGWYSGDADELVDTYMVVLEDDVDG